MITFNSCSSEKQAEVDMQTRAWSELRTGLSDPHESTRPKAGDATKERERHDSTRKACNATKQAEH